MCLLAIKYRSVPEAPILVAANREEAYDRSSLNPSIQAGKPRILCGIDTRAGGTWLGVNQQGLVVGVCNRPKMAAPMAPKSRGVLCREMLRTNSSRQAVDLAMEELSSGKYDGCNFVVADQESGWVVHGGEDVEVVELEDGLSIVSSMDVNDLRDERGRLCRRLLTLQTLDSAVKFLARASQAFSRPSASQGRPGMVLRSKERGTVSSTLIALGKKPRDAIFQYAAGSPDEAKYDDYSPMLRDILSRGLRESRTRAKA
jgi:hypothetical protein